VFADSNVIGIAVAGLIIWEFINVLLECVCGINAVKVSGYEVQVMNSNTNKDDIPLCMKTQMQ
jgi:hypothetical protein